MASSASGGHREAGDGRGGRAERTGRWARWRRHGRLWGIRAGERHAFEWVTARELKTEGGERREAEKKAWEIAGKQSR